MPASRHPAGRHSAWCLLGRADVPYIAQYRAVTIFAILVFLALLTPAMAVEPHDPETTRWVMLHVQGQVGQADCHLVTLPDGRHILIDAAEAVDAPGAVLSQLHRHGVAQIALAIVSHFHADHYGRLLDVIDAGIHIDRVIANPPGDRRIADRERPWGCDYDHVMATLEGLSARGVPWHIPVAGERLITATTATGETAGIDVICAYDGIHTPIGETDINDTSIVIRLFHGTTRVLFTGDLNHRLGAFLAASDFDIRADILKAPHHGTEGCPPDSFFDRVDPDAILVPSPTALWLSSRSRRIREYFAERDIPAFINGIHGNVTVSLTSGRYRIRSEIRRIDQTRALSPRVLIPPRDANVAAGAQVTLSVTTEGRSGDRIQWFHNGRPIPGADQPSYAIPAVTDDDAGTYFVVVTNAHGAVESPSARLALTEARPPDAPTTLSNLSVRGHAGAADSALVAGFVIGGEGSKSLLIRAVGPSLSAFGVSDPLPDPRLVVTTLEGRVLAQNDNWGASRRHAMIAELTARLGAFPLDPHSRDAAVIVALPPGVYTATASDHSAESGVALIELYDVAPFSAAYLVNLSARSHVQQRNGDMIAGFVTAGNGEVTLLCRVVGPSLGAFGIHNTLPEPSLLFDFAVSPPDSDQPQPRLLRDPGELARAARITGAFDLAEGSSEPVLLLVTPRGPRTAIARSASHGGGIGLIELYLVP